MALDWRDIWTAARRENGDIGGDLAGLPADVHLSGLVFVHRRRFGRYEIDADAFDDRGRPCRPEYVLEELAKQSTRKMALFVELRD